MLAMIMQGVENKPDNVIMLCINPWCVYILNIEYNIGLNSQYIVEKKEDAEKGRWSIARQSPCEETKQTEAENKRLRGYKTVNHKVKIRTQK